MLWLPLVNQWTVNQRATLDESWVNSQQQGLKHMGRSRTGSYGSVHKSKGQTHASSGDSHRFPSDLRRRESQYLLKHLHLQQSQMKESGNRLQMKPLKLILGGATSALPASVNPQTGE